MHGQSVYPVTKSNFSKTIAMKMFSKSKKSFKQTYSDRSQKFINVQTQYIVESHHYICINNTFPSYEFKTNPQVIDKK